MRRPTNPDKPIPNRNHSNSCRLQNQKVLGLVTGLTPRTRGIFGQFMAGFESMVGGEVTAFTSEVEKARWEAIERAKNRALALGANAIIGMDVETSDMAFKTGLCFSPQLEQR
jgi:uncharacterized protein YbjQ (UPF0145 family)